MTIPSQRIAQHLVPGTTLDLRHPDGSCFRADCPYEHLVFLSEHMGISGKATRGGRLRYAILEMKESEADAIIANGERTSAHRIPGRYDVEASRTSQQQTIDGARLTFKAWRHVRNAGFNDGVLRVLPVHQLRRDPMKRRPVVDAEEFIESLEVGSDYGELNGQRQ